jgi:hypothetical protein
MPARKMRVELFDSEGNRYTVSFEGQITREKALRLLDLVELLGGAPSGGGNPEAVPSVGGNEFSKFDKVRMLVQKSFPIVWFSSREVQSMYEHEYNEPVGLSTIATYLARLSTKGLLVKSGTPKSLKYKVVLSLPQATLKR